MYLYTIGVELFVPKTSSLLAPCHVDPIDPSLSSTDSLPTLQPFPDTLFDSPLNSSYKVGLDLKIPSTSSSTTTPEPVEPPTTTRDFRIGSITIEWFDFGSPTTSPPPPTTTMTDSIRSEFDRIINPTSPSPPRRPRIRPTTGSFIPYLHGTTELNIGILHLYRDAKELEQLNELSRNKSSENNSESVDSDRVLADVLGIAVKEGGDSGELRSEVENNGDEEWTQVMKKRGKDMRNAGDSKKIESVALKESEKKNDKVAVSTNITSSSSSSSYAAVASLSSPSPSTNLPTSKNFISQALDNGTVLCILGVPTYITTQDFLKFVAPYRHEITHIRLIKDSTPGKYMVLLKFRNNDSSWKFYKHHNGKPFFSFSFSLNDDDEPSKEICHVVFLRKIEFLKNVVSPDFSGPFLHTLSPLPSDPHTHQLIELPTCPVCLERMDSTVSGLLTILCHHTFHCDCLRKWQDTSCPVCRYTAPTSHEDDDSHQTQTQCSDCQSCENLWICLICGNIGCGRYTSGRHAYRHFLDTNHVYALEVETSRVWDYVGDGYVHRLIQNKEDGKLVELPPPERGGGGRRRRGVSSRRERERNNERSRMKKKMKTRGVNTDREDDDDDAGKVTDEEDAITDEFDDEDDSESFSENDDENGTEQDLETGGYEDDDDDDDEGAEHEIDEKEKGKGKRQSKSKSKSKSHGKGKGAQIVFDSSDSDYEFEGEGGGIGIGIGAQTKSSDKKPQNRRQHRHRHSTQTHSISYTSYQEKLDALGLEYTYLLTSQLESQRQFYETQLVSLRESFSQEISTTREMIMELQNKCEALQNDKLEFGKNMEKKLADISMEKRGIDKKWKDLSTVHEKLVKEYGEEKLLTESLKSNVQNLKSQLDKKDEQVAELNDQVRDLMFFLESQQKIQQSELRDEIAGGSIVVKEGGGSSSSGGSKKGNRRKK